MNSVKQFSDGVVSNICTSSNISDFVKYSDEIFYYSSNAVTSKKSGIFKVDVSDSEKEPVITQIFKGKSDNLAINDDMLYFTNGNEDDRLYRMNLTDLSTELFLDEKVHEYIIDGNRLYCTVNGTINDYIGYINLSSEKAEAIKLTNYAGEFLRVHNGYVYFNNSDLFTKVDSSKYGIWKINTLTRATTQVLATESVSGFDIDSQGRLYYVDSTDSHLYRYSESTKTKTDMLANFEAPVITPMNTGGRTIAYGSKIYYLNMYAGKSLFVYDENTKKTQQVTDSKVEDFSIVGDELYFNQVTRLTNNDIYTVNLKTGGEATLVSTNDVRNMIVNNGYIYGTHYNWAGVSGGISRMKLDGTEYVKFSDVNGAKNLAIKDSRLYYINSGNAQDNGNIEYIDIASITAESEDLKGTNISTDIKNVKQFIFDGNDIFYIYNGTINNYIARTSFDSLGEGTKIAFKENYKTNPNEMIAYGDYIYYFSYPASAVKDAGFYRVKKNATVDGTQEKILKCGDSTYLGNKGVYGEDMAITSNGYLYFLNYISKLQIGDAYTYRMSLSSKTLEKLD